MRERQRLDASLAAVRGLQNELADAEGLIAMAEAEGEAELIAEAETSLDALRGRAEQLRLESMLSGEADANDTYLEVHAGAGGTESQDWAEMLFRMYTRWAERHGYKLQLIEESEGEGTGLKSLTAGSRQKRACTVWCAFRRSTPTRAGIRASPASPSFP